MHERIEGWSRDQVADDSAVPQIVVVRGGRGKASLRE
jgi:hypothetical protein